MLSLDNSSSTSWACSSLGTPVSKPRACLRRRRAVQKTQTWYYGISPSPVAPAAQLKRCDVEDPVNFIGASTALLLKATRLVEAKTKRSRFQPCPPAHQCIHW